MRSLIWQILLLTGFSQLIVWTFLLSLTILGKEGEQMYFFLQPNHCHTWPTLAAKEDDLGSSLSLGSAQCGKGEGSNIQGRAGP